MALLLIGLNAACTGMPERVEAVSGFDLDHYLGTWYEIARLDHGFERGLQRVSAQYSLRADGGVRVINRGFDVSRGEWREAEGKAYFLEGPQTGRLKVSFFGPFYGSYNIIELDKADYRYALVCGPDASYLWILASQPQLEPAILRRLIARAESIGFDTERLIYVQHEAQP